MAGKQGPIARTLLPQEAVLLLHGRAATTEGGPAEEAARALIAAPRKLAELASQWAARALVGEDAGEQKKKVGLCRLRWEDETERVLYAWIRDNPPTQSAMVGRVGGGRGRRGKGKDKPPIFFASKTISRLLRHDGGREDLPMSHEGWVKWQDLMTHARLRGYSQQVLYDAVMINDKERFTAIPDREGQWWVAAWSGHTIPGCVGPSRVVPSAEVPTILVHARHLQTLGAPHRGRGASTPKRCASSRPASSCKKVETGLGGESHRGHGHSSGAWLQLPSNWKPCLVVQPDHPGRCYHQLHRMGRPPRRNEVSGCG